jgi:hypothetical protein
METLLTESMILYFLFFWAAFRKLPEGAFFWKLFLKLRGNFRQNGTQLELIEYHAKC